GGSAEAVGQARDEPEHAGDDPGGEHEGGGGEDTHGVAEARREEGSPPILGRCCNGLRGRRKKYDGRDAPRYCGARPCLYPPLRSIATRRIGTAGRPGNTQ